MPNKNQARALLEYSEARDGYWTSDKQMERAVKITETKYLRKMLDVWSGFLPQQLPCFHG